MAVLGALASGCTERRSSSVDRDAGASSRRAGVTLEGAGATFPKPIYAQWSLRYLESTSVKVAYEPVGSEAGIEAIREGTVDFGASDIPLADEQLDEYGLCQFPIVIGAVVPVANLPGIDSGQLKLTAESLAAIYLGTVKRWNDPAIADDNPGVALPNEDIIPIHRADASGTTWIFTSYLSESDEAWRAAVGTGHVVNWPAGVGARGNAQIAKFVSQFKHTVGYVEYSYALQNDLSCISLRDPSGSHVTPSREAFELAARGGQVGETDALRMTFGADPAVGSWPIVGASYALVRRDQAQLVRAQTMLRFFHWALTAGAEHARRLEYVTIPVGLVERIEQSWRECVRSTGAQLWLGVGSTSTADVETSPASDAASGSARVTAPHAPSLSASAPTP